MKNTNKNIAAAIIISAFFFVPVFCSAQVAGGRDNIDPSTNLANPSTDNNVTEEEDSYLEAIMSCQMPNVTLPGRNYPFQFEINPGPYFDDLHRTEPDHPEGG